MTARQKRNKAENNRQWMLLLHSGVIPNWPQLNSLFLLNACSGIKVVADGDPTDNWSEYTTYQYYRWAEESDQLLTRFDKERIEDVFGNEFKRRGMKYVESGGDIIVSLFIVIEQKTSQTASTTSMGGGYGGYYGGGITDLNPDTVGVEDTQQQLFLSIITR